MKPKLAYAIVAVVAAIAIFPPVDTVVPAREPLIHMGTTLRAGEAEVVWNGGFKFIGSMESNERIRMGQWLVQLGVAGMLGAIVVVLASRGNQP